MAADIGSSRLLGLFDLFAEPSHSGIVASSSSQALTLYREHGVDLRIGSFFQLHDAVVGEKAESILGMLFLFFPCLETLLTSSMGEDNPTPRTT